MFILGGGGDGGGFTGGKGWQARDCSLRPHFNIWVFLRRSQDDFQSCLQDYF